MVSPPWGDESSVSLCSGILQYLFQHSSLCCGAQVMLGGMDSVCDGFHMRHDAWFNA